MVRILHHEFLIFRNLSHKKTYNEVTRLGYLYFRWFQSIYDQYKWTYVYWKISFFFILGLLTIKHKYSVIVTTSSCSCSPTRPVHCHYWEQCNIDFYFTQVALTLLYKYSYLSSLVRFLAFIPVQETNLTSLFQSS